jgi:hypothetical protein
MAGRSETHTIQAERLFEARSTESFNRIAYAIALLKLLNLGTTVAVYRNSRQLRVERVSRVLGDRALLGIPPHATREAIARSVAELGGYAEQPFMLDLLCAVRPEALG